MYTTGLFSGEVPPFLALCSQGIRDKRVFTATEMHQLNSKQVWTNWDEHAAIP